MSSSQENGGLERENVEILKSSKGKDLLSISGYIFHFNQQLGDRTYWECRARQHRNNAEMKCKGRAISQGFGERLKLLSHDSKKHCHEPDPVYVMKVKLSNELKRRGRADSSTPAKVMRDAGNGFPQAVQGRLSSLAQKKIVKRARKGDLVEPTTLENFTVPEEYTKTTDGDKFFQGWVKPEGQNEKALVFAANEDIRRLAKARFWIADGTFDTVPGLFTQLFTIHGSIGPDHKRTYPFVYVLMTGRKQELYTEVLDRIKEVADELEVLLNPEAILTDFEKGMINAFNEAFPDASKQGCFFHLSQNLWKSVKEHKLTISFGSNNEIFSNFKQLQALSFVPAEKIPAAFDIVACSAGLEYFSKTYVYGKSTLNKNSKPTYDPGFWSVYNSVLKGLPRTTNKIEAWHSRWNSIVGAKHVGVFRIMEEMKLEQKYTDGRVLASQAGEKETKKKSFEERDSRLENIVKRYDNLTISEYLTAIAGNLGSNSE